MSRKKKSSRKLGDKFLPESVLANQENGTGTLDQPFIGSAWNNDRRIKDCAAARELYVRLFFEAQLRQQSFAQIRNQIEGGRPFDPNELQRNGESWRTNVNFNDARAAFRRVSLPYWKMVHEVPRKISVDIHAPKMPDLNRTCIALAECFDMFLDDWGPDYFHQFSGFCDDYVMYGTGHSMWPVSSSPRFVWTPSIQMMMPKRTKSNVDKWELICMKRELTADELLQHVKGEARTKDSETAGWNPAMIMQAIRLACPAPNQNRYFDPNYWQDMIVSNDLVIGGVWPPVSVVDMWAYSPEEKKIMHYIFTEKSDVPDFLFEAAEEETEFRRIFGTAFYNVGSNGLYHAIKGFGVMNYYYATAINRTKCRLVDGATFAMGMNFVKGDDTPDEAPPVENYSMINIFPKGLDQLQYYPNLGAAQQLVGMLEQNQDENNFTYNEPQRDIADTKTAKQAEILGSIANEMSTAGSSVFLSQMGTNIYAECFRRLIKKDSKDKDAKKFRRRAVDLGVDPKIIDLMATDEDTPDHLDYTVKTGASPTMASPMMRQQIGNALMTQIMPQPGSNRRAILEFQTASLAGSEGVTQFLLPVGQDSDPRAQREAMMENGDLAQGMPLPADPSDAHVEHLMTHLPPMEAICQQVQQAKQSRMGAPMGGAPGQPPQAGPQTPLTPSHLIALQMGVPHCGQHLQMLSGNPAQKAQYQALKARFTQVASIAQGLMARLSKAHAMAQQSGQALQPADVATAIGGAQQ